MPYPREWSICGTHNCIMVAEMDGAPPKCKVCEAERMAAIKQAIERMVDDKQKANSHENRP